MKAPDNVKRLVERFGENIDAYKSGKYNETQVRREFLDPFWKELGWDMDNSGGRPERTKDVIHEYSMKVDDSTKAPDYCFRASGRRKFFLEAKKPSIDIKGAIHPAYQLRRYAWSAKLPVSLLSDFEEFALYDCRVAPKHTDNAAVARMKYLTYADYVERWEELHGLFSRERVYDGVLEKFYADESQKKGTAGVDDSFLREIEKWRDSLARTIAIRNPALTNRELNFAVQRTIDRIIFLRICEDRGIEPYGSLQAAAKNDNVYANLLTLFHGADAKYNSGIFHFSCEKGECETHDELTPGLAIDDKPLKDIITHLYYPVSPFEFSVLPADILGQVYEQFLGKVIRLTPAHRAVVEEKPEVKKAGGVYYTPTYIVDYIAKHTLGTLLSTMTLEDIRKRPLRALDLSCGSGSFLIVLYQYLLDWYLERYTEKTPEKYSKGKEAPLVSVGDGWKLSTVERKRILLEHIYGVDIDSQAVEVTKLSLLLKVLEEETSDSISAQLSMFHERALPDLGNNIKCGNALVGYDIDVDKNGQRRMFTDEERVNINAFDWESEFPFKFDVIGGNPPYVRQETLGDLKEYLQEHYDCYHGVADLYVYFIEKAIKLLAPGGYFSYIVANKWMRANYGEPLRRWLKTKHVEEIIDFGDLRVFKQATTYPCILRVRNLAAPAVTFKAVKMDSLDFTDLDGYVKDRFHDISVGGLDDGGWSLVNEASQKVLDKIKAVGMPLGEYVKGAMYRGVLTGLNEAFVIDGATREKLIAEDPKSAELIKPFLVGKDIKRYTITDAGRYLILIPKGWTREKMGGVREGWRWLQSNYPAIAKHLEPHEKAGLKRYDKGEQWWELRACDYYAEFEKPKILWPGISAQINAFALDTLKYYGNDNNQLLVTGDKYLLGVLNSRVTRFKLQSICDKVQGGFYRLKMVYVEQLPIRTIDFTNPADRARHDKVVALVETMLALHKKLAAATLGHDKTALERQIDATDRQIDALVYELYGLTEDEIGIVEGEG